MIFIDERTSYTRWVTPMTHHKTITRCFCFNRFYHAQRKPVMGSDTSKQPRVWISSICGGGWVPCRQENRLDSCYVFDRKSDKTCGFLITMSGRRDRIIAGWSNDKEGARSAKTKFLRDWRQMRKELYAMKVVDLGNGHYDEVHDHIAAAARAKADADARAEKKAAKSREMADADADARARSVHFDDDDGYGNDAEAVALLGVENELKRRR